MWTTSLYDTTKVTLELRDLVENGVNIWDFDYPSYYEGDKKKEFEQKVIDHYYFRQLGQETVGRFKHYFKTRIREIMPRYIDMYRTVEIMKNVEDPFGNVDITETYEEETTGSTSGTSSGTSTSSSTDTTKVKTDHERRFSNTPQGSITNLDNYMTEATVESNTDQHSGGVSANGSTSSEDTTTHNGTVRHTFTKKGNQGVNTYAHDIIEFRQSIIDVDMMIIEELNDLFLKVY